MAAFPLLLLSFTVSQAHAGILRSSRTLLLCHRTANRDLPDNTLESLALAAHMGCDIVEIDVRQTLDGELVLNHDGILDRFTDTTGDVEDTDLRELDRLDFGGWMGARFQGMHIAHFHDALHLARRLKIGLYLDIKTKGIGKQVLSALAEAGMTDQVVFGGEWDDIRQLDPEANADAHGDLQPGFTRPQVEALHAQHKVAIANFILNGHEFDLDGMKQAVAFGVDGIMVDYPRLGAEAVGRPVEAKIALLLKSANHGAVEQRAGAVRELSSFIGFPLQDQFFHLLMDADDRVSQQAALALVTERPVPLLASFRAATRSSTPAARANAAWAIGSLASTAHDGTGCASLLEPLIADPNIAVLEQALIALSRCQPNPQVVPAAPLLRLLSSDVPVVRGLAAVALATHHPEQAAHMVPALLQKDQDALESYETQWTARGRPPLSQSEIGHTVELYRAEMKELHAVELLPDRPAFSTLATEAFRPGNDYSSMPIYLAGANLWDRLGKNPEPALKALASSDSGTADSAEWALAKAGPEVLPSLRAALVGSNGTLRRRIIRILGWQADSASLPLLQSLRGSDPSDKDLIDWSIASIRAFSTELAR